MTARQINAELDRLDVEHGRLLDRFIDAGRGSEREQETTAKAKEGDRLAIAWVEIRDRYANLRIEILTRYGPGAPSRLPSRGFGPRR